MEIKEFIINFVDQFEDIELDEVNGETKFKEFEEWSSLTAMSIISMVKKRYNKTITGKDFRYCETVWDLFNLIKNK